MKNAQTIILSLFAGLIITGLSYFIEIDKGDFVYRGFPIGYHNGIWGNGFEWYFSPRGLLFDFVIWSLIVFITLKLFTTIRKKYIT